MVNEPVSCMKPSVDFLYEDGFVVHVLEHELEFFLVVVAKEDPGLSHLPACQSSFVEDIRAGNNCTLDSLY